MTHERESMMTLIKEAMDAGARQIKACAIVGISGKTYQRWSQAHHGCGDGRQSAHHQPTNKLSDLERRHLLNVANSPEYQHLSPSQIVPKLADKGIYIASESTFYRVLREENQLQHRQKSKPTHPAKKPKALVATGPNQIYSWDITYLPTVVKGLFFYLYLVMDIYSRKVVGWQVYHDESSALAADLMRDICQQENIQPKQVTLHSDNGSPMKGATMLATLQQLGIMPSFSRPSVSNDNPYSESLFRTLKYRPEYPEHPFEDLVSARQWVHGFVQWYNHEHQHSAISFVTPQQRHLKQDTAILQHRTDVYHQAKSRHPERWSKEIRSWKKVREVSLNPEKSKKTNLEEQAA